MATVIIRIFHDISAVPAVSVNGPANDPEGVNIQRLRDYYTKSPGRVPTEAYFGHTCYMLQMIVKQEEL